MGRCGWRRALLIQPLFQPCIKLFFCLIELFQLRFVEFQLINQMPVPRKLNSSIKFPGKAYVLRAAVQYHHRIRSLLCTGRSRRNTEGHHNEHEGEKQ